MGKSRVDESTSCAINLTLRERPQLNGLHAAGERVGEISQSKNSGGAGEQEAPGPGVGVHRDLDRAKQLGRQLDLVNDQETVMVHEAGGIVPGGPQRGWVVEQADQRVGRRRGGEPGQRALTGLSGAIDGDHPGVAERFSDQRLRLAADQVAMLGHPSIMVTWPLPAWTLSRT
jgi:hypothetical protein